MQLFVLKTKQKKNNAVVYFIFWKIMQLFIWQTNNVIIDFIILYVIQILL